MSGPQAGHVRVEIPLTAAAAPISYVTTCASPSQSSSEPRGTANCKAIWLGEPSHREALTGSTDHGFTSTEELECLASAASVYESELRKGEELRIDRLFACPPGTGSLPISYRLFFDIDAGHRAIVEAGGRQTVLDRDFTTARLAAEAPTPALARLVLLGVEHILFGIDHVLFLIALMLGLPRAGPAVAMVSAFTIAWRVFAESGREIDQVFLLHLHQSRAHLERRRLIVE